MDPIVETLQGKLRGHLSNGVATFKGVPYAAPPFGANRLCTPQPIEPWDGVRDALAFGPKSPQVSYPRGIAECLAELVGAGEDCLTLNIWTLFSHRPHGPSRCGFPAGCSNFTLLARQPSMTGADSPATVSCALLSITGWVPRVSSTWAMA